MNPDLIIAQELVYDKCGYEYTTPLKESESAEYSACLFKLNGQTIKYRNAKITPTKIGQFVTLWKRKGDGPIQPFDSSDPIDLFIINVRKGNHLGQFIFPKSVLIAQGILSTKKKEGKRAMRVYPPWDITTSKQAQKTQQWQLEYFLDIPSKKPLDLVLAKKLLNHPTKQLFP
jgi:hypothetical protein